MNKLQYNKNLSTDEKLDLLLMLNSSIISYIAHKEPLFLEYIDEEMAKFNNEALGGEHE